MVKIDLITGFLGSGKTTFIRKYAKYLIEHGYNIGILENDYGAINVDMMLLSDLMGDKCELEMISGGCDKETHRRRFRTKLIAMGMCGYDRVLVEPSGIYDVDEFFDVLRDEPLDRWYEIGNVFTIVDATLEENLSEASRYLLASEVADAGAVALSKVQNTTPEMIEKTIHCLNTALAQVKCRRKIDDSIFAKNWDALCDADFEKLMQAGYVQESYVKQDIAEDDVFTSLYFMNLNITKTQLEACVEKLFADQNCGNIFRIKGFITDEDAATSKSESGENIGNSGCTTEKNSRNKSCTSTENIKNSVCTSENIKNSECTVAGKTDSQANIHWLELNATKNEMTFKPAPDGQKVLIVIGEHLNKEAIEAYFKI